MVELGFPFQLAADGRPTSPGYEQHVFELVEQVLFTRPGERVNRPTFGVGLDALVFEPANAAFVAALQANIKAQLQSALSGIIQLGEVSVTVEQGVVVVRMSYVIVQLRKQVDQTLTVEA